VKISQVPVGTGCVSARELCALVRSLPNAAHLISKAVPPG